MREIYKIFKNKPSKSKASYSFPLSLAYCKNPAAPSKIFFLWFKVGEKFSVSLREIYSDLERRLLKNPFRKKTTYVILIVFKVNVSSIGV